MSVTTSGSSITPTLAATESPKQRVMESPGTLRSGSQMRSGPTGCRPTEYEAMRPCGDSQSVFSSG